MTDKERIIAGLKCIDVALEHFKEINNIEMKNIMFDLYNGLEVCAERLLSIINAKSIKQ